MSDALLWSLAIGVGAVGLLLLAVAGVAATILGGRLPGRPGSSARQPAVYGENTRSAEHPQSRGEQMETMQPEGGGPSAGADGGGRHTNPILAWLKAWIFAFIHAGAVSFVLGGVTFFEDLLRANEEIQRTGTVTFPKRLLPGTFSEAEVPRPLVDRSGEDGMASGYYGRYHLRREASGGRDHPDASSAETVDWEVVDILDEAGADGEALAGGYRPSG